MVWSNSHMTDRPQASVVRQEVTVVTAPWHTYTAFGITWKTDIPWPEPTAETDEPAGDVLVQLVAEAEIVRRWSGRGDDPTWLLRIDGRPLVVERGLHGDFRLSHESGLFHVDADGTSVACATSDPSDPWWLRLVLDTILWSTALLRGVEALHASAVATEHGVVAFVGPTGSGKTTLALEFLRRGYSLFCDDVLALRRDGGELMAYPSPPFVNVPIGWKFDKSVPIRPIAILGDEAWSVAPDASREAAPLARLFLLDREPRSRLELIPAKASLFALRESCLAHGLISQRERARFELCADLATHVPVSHLRADLETSPEELADLVERALERSGAVP